MIVAKQSPLILVDFAIIQSNGIFIADPDPEYDLRKKMDQYPVEIDFGIGEQKQNLYRIQSKVSINHPLNGTPQSGYSLFAESAGFFTFNNDDNLTEQQKQEFLQFSALSICITNLRLYIANITSYFPFGKYQFPSIDINALLLEKAKISNNMNDNIK